MIDVCSAFSLKFGVRRTLSTSAPSCCKTIQEKHVEQKTKVQQKTTSTTTTVAAAAVATTTATTFACHENSTALFSRKPGLKKNTSPGVIHQKVRPFRMSPLLHTPPPPSLLHGMRAFMRNISREPVDLGATMHTLWDICRELDSWNALNSAKSAHAHATSAQEYIKSICCFPSFITR